MGGQLVKLSHAAMFQASKRGVVFSSNEARILVYMASIAMDTDKPPVYWAGRDVLAEIALLRTLPAGDDPEARKARESIFKSVSIATRGLVEKGALQLRGAARPGRTQEYELTVENLLPFPSATESDVPPLGTSRSTIQNLTFHHSEPDVPDGGTPASTRNQETNTPTDQSETTTHLRRVPHFDPVNGVAA